MCGIVGWISRDHTDSFDKKRFMEQALIIDTVRGWDSAGVFVVPKKKMPADMKPYWFKQLGSGFDLVCTKEYQEIYSNGKSSDLKFSVGHNRSATLGGAVIEGAHPFQNGPITLVHNGTVNEGETKKTREAKGFINDSETICHMLTEDTPDAVVSKLQGAFALVWYDQRDDSLNIIRNSQRPMHLAKAKKDDTIYFASEGEMLHLLGIRLQIQLGCIVALKPGYLLKFKEPDLMVPEVRELKFFTQPVFQPTKKSAETNWNTGVNYQTGTSTTPHLNGNKNLDSEFYARMSAEKKGKIVATSKRKKIDKSSYVPDQCQLELCDLDMDIETEYNFAPLEAIKIDWGRNSGPSYTVMGRVLCAGNKITWGIIHGVAPHVWDTCKNRLWTVWPMARLDQGWENRGLVCRLKQSLGKGGGLMPLLDIDRDPPFPNNTPNDLDPLGMDYSKKEKAPKGASKSRKKPASGDTQDVVDAIKKHLSEEEASDITTQGVGDGVTYPGPGNRTLTHDEFLERTEGGCTNCGEGLTISDAFKIEWVNTDIGLGEPMCVRCQNERDRALVR